MDDKTRQFLTEKVLGECWHEWTANPGFLWNPDTTVTMCLKCGKLGEEPNYNYPFDTREGFHLIIEHGPKMEWWEEFLDDTQIGVSLEPWVFDCQGNDISHREWAIKQDYIGPQLAIELNRFLEGREGR